MRRIGPNPKVRGFHFITCGRSSQGGSRTEGTLVPEPKEKVKTREARRSVAAKLLRNKIGSLPSSRHFLRNGKSAILPELGRPSLRAIPAATAVQPIAAIAVDDIIGHRGNRLSPAKAGNSTVSSSSRSIESSLRETLRRYVETFYSWP